MFCRSHQNGYLFDILLTFITLFGQHNISIKRHKYTKENVCYTLCEYRECNIKNKH